MKHPALPANNMALMAAIGAQRYEGYTAMPPRQHLSFLDFRESEEVRVIAWLWSVTIQKGKGKKAWGYARDKRGVLTLKHMAADLNMELSNCSAAYKRCVEKGRARTDDDGRLWLCGNVPDPELSATVESADDAGEDPAKPSNPLICTDKLKVAWSVYLQALPENERNQRESDLEKLAAYREQLKTDAIALAREAGEKVVARYFAAIEFVPPEETRGRTPKPRENHAVQLKLVQVPPLSVQITPEASVADSVQNSVAILYKGQAESAQISASLLGSKGVKGTQGKKNSIQPSSSSFPATIAALGEIATADDDAIRQLVDRCEEERSDATDEEIAHFVRAKVRLSRGTRNPIGFLLTAVPKCFVGGAFAEYRAKSAQQRQAQAATEERMRVDAERYQKEMRMQLDDPNISEKEKALILEVLGIGTKTAGASS